MAQTASEAPKQEGQTQLQKSTSEVAKASTNLEGAVEPQQQKVNN